ncbi:hypothetical protein ACIA49_13075 [Kribbella sp. NPDC051587]|uniref:hypothetical protein n=1 Tax=Kribbella sp. NPDC051587 TaxID=3364119 RepID=UPI0037A88BE1
MSTAEDLQVFPSDMQPPVDEVVAVFEREFVAGRSREAAELAYAAATRLQARGRVGDASVYARHAFALLEQLPDSTIEQVTSTRSKVGGVNIPELLHVGVIKARLGHLLD